MKIGMLCKKVLTKMHFGTFYLSFLFNFKNLKTTEKQKFTFLLIKRYICHIIFFSLTNKI